MEHLRRSLILLVLPATSIGSKLAKCQAVPAQIMRKGISASISSMWVSLLSTHDDTDGFQVLINVLKARTDLAYQLAFLTTELTEIFDGAPPSPQAGDPPSSTTDTGGKRKPIDGDCPVCVMEFEEAENTRREIVWCKAACGQNVHRRCFEQVCQFLELLFPVSNLSRALMPFLDRPKHLEIFRKGIESPEAPILFFNHAMLTPRTCSGPKQSLEKYDVSSAAHLGRETKTWSRGSTRKAL